MCHSLTMSVARSMTLLVALNILAPFSITINIFSQLRHQKTLCVVKRNIMTQYLIAPVFNFNNTLNTNP